MVKEDFYYSLFSERFKKLLESINDKKPNYCVEVLSFIDFVYSVSYAKNHDLVRSAKAVKMLDYREQNGDHAISYLAIGKHPEYTDVGKWARKNRQEGKIGKVVLNFIKVYQPILKFRLPTAAEIEDFVNSFKMVLSYSSFSFKLVSGEDIKRYYSVKSYAETDNGGYTLWSSCMKYDKCQEYFDIYTNTPECELLIMFDESISKEKIVARALVWNLNGQKYVDRRYYCIDIYEKSMIQYIKNQGWAYKACNTYDDCYNMNFNVPEANIYKERNDIKIIIPVKLAKRYPYVDTLKFLDKNNSTISNYKTSECYRMNYTDGGYDTSRIRVSENIIRCQCCNADFDQSLARTVYNPAGTCVTACPNCYVNTIDDGARHKDMVFPVYDQLGVRYVSKRNIDSYAILVEGKYYLTPKRSSSSLIVKLASLEGELDDNVKIIKIDKDHGLLLVQ